MIERARTGPELMELIDLWWRSRERPVPPAQCSVCGALWDRHPMWTLLRCVKVLERRADKRETMPRYFLPQETKRAREEHLRRALQYRRKQRS
jgi:hypothetical protein